MFWAVAQTYRPLPARVWLATRVLPAGRVNTGFMLQLGSSRFAANTGLMLQLGPTRFAANTGLMLQLGSTRFAASPNQSSPYI